VHILDRFHIVAKMNKALDEVRAGEARRLAQDGYEPVLKRTRWCVLKRKTNLTGKQRFRLRELLRASLPAERRLPTILGIPVSDVGRQVPRRLVPAGHALAHPAHEEDRCDDAKPSRAAPQLFPSQEAALERRS
jgi:Transposase